MSEIVYTGQFDTEQLKRLIAGLSFGSTALFLGERLPTDIVSPEERRNLLRFIPFHRGKETGVEFTNYSPGRIFQQDAELRWEKMGDKLRVVYLGTQDYTSVLGDYEANGRIEKLPETQEPKLTYYYLFGKRLEKEELEQLSSAAQEGDFAEVRIPHFLRYPVEQSDKPYVRLAVREYLDNDTGQVTLFRFQGLEPAE